MNANIITTQIFNQMKCELKCQLRSHKVIFVCLRGGEDD